LDVLTQQHRDEGHRIPSGTVTFVFTDIEGSTKLFHELGDAYIRVLDEHHKILREAIAAHDGVEIKTEGDAFFIAYDEPANAILSMRDAQLALASHSFSHGRPVRVRMGIHVGPVAIVDDDYVGLSVHEAARIAGAAHGGQILVSEDMVEAVNGDLPSDIGFHDLGRHALKDFPQPKRLMQVTAPGLDTAFAAPRTLTARGHNLPASPTKLVGRDTELTQIQSLLVGDARLVTLSGGGGFGKSRLAIEVGWSLLSWFREGVWFVALAAVTDERDVVPTINRAIGITDEPDREPLDLLVQRLSAGPTLLVLDNLEQLGDGVVLVADLLAACPDLRVLATSRERLRLRGENEIALDGLSIDEAVALFVERAEANNPCTDLGTPEEIAAVTELARYVDGVPLALELAAALVRDQAPTQLVPQLERTLDLLTEGERDLPQRQRTLRSTIAWSHDLLDDTDRRVFELMALFAGGASLPALTAITSQLGVGLDETAIEATAQRLADKALVRRSAQAFADEGARWWVLQTIHQFATERLATRPDELARGRLVHATWFSDWVEELSGHGDIEQGRRYDMLAREIDNLRLALLAGNGHRARLAIELTPFWDTRGHWREGVRWLDEVTEHASNDGERVRLLMSRARLDQRLFRLTDAEGRLRDARALVATIEDDSLRSRCASELANVVLSLANEEGQSEEFKLNEVTPPRERLDEAKALLDEATTHARRSHDAGAEAHARWQRAELLLGESDLDACLEDAEAAIALYRMLGDHQGAAESSFTICKADLGLGRFQEAVDHCVAGIEDARAVGDRSTEGQMMWIEAVGRFNLGERDASYAIAEAAHELFAEAGDEVSAASILFVRGELAKMARDFDGAREWFTRSRDAWHAFGDERRAKWCDDAIAELENVSG
jgi:predicted ATPase/class 3 adenylate cyclase